MRNYNPLDLPLGEAPRRFGFLQVPCTINGGTLKDPQQGQDHVTQNEDSNHALYGPNDVLARCDSQQEQADGDLGGHKGEKCLDPFSIAVLLEFLDLMVLEIILVSPESIVDIGEIEAGANDGSNLLLY